jgi:hypothetical protein
MGDKRPKMGGRGKGAEREGKTEGGNIEGEIEEKTQRKDIV